MPSTLRTLRRSPGFSATAILTLALAIGASTTIFSVLNTVILRPLPYPTSERLTNLWETRTAGEVREISISVEDYTDWRDRNRVFVHLAARSTARMTLTGGTQAEFVEGSNVTANLFDALAVQPALGRNFDREEEKVGGPPVVILTAPAFDRLFHSDPTALGKTIILDGTAYTVVGVMPPGFKYPIYHDRGEFFLPLLRMKPEGRASHPGISGVGLLRPGVSLRTAQSDMNRIARELSTEYPASNRNTGIGVAMLKARWVEDIEATLLVLFGAVTFLLLIGCSNVASLLMARAAGRRQEMAIRTALGATQTDLVKQVLRESIALSTLAGALGVGLSLAGVRGLVLLLPANTPRVSDVAVDGQALVFALAVSVLTGFAFGLMPALQAARRSIGDAIRDSGARAGDSRQRQRSRNVLVVAEVALSLVLLTGAALAIRSFDKLVSTSPGFETGRLVSIDFRLPLEKYANQQRQSAFFRELLDRTKAVRGVESAALAVGMFGGFQQELQIEGVPIEPGKPVAVDAAYASPDYFKTLSIPLKRGRTFTDADRTGSIPVAIVDEVLASSYFPGQNAIGKRIRVGTGDWLEIVGVVGHVKSYGVDQPSRAEAYRAQAQATISFSSLVVKIDGNQGDVIAALRGEVKRLDGDLPLGRVRNLAETIEQGRAGKRTAATLLTIFAVLALALAAVGLYGVIAYSVVQRTREMGVRMALGADRGNILRLLLWQGARLAAVGMGLGLGCSAVLTRYLKSLLFGISPLDLPTFGASTLVIGMVAIAAALIPAWRATRVDPMTALRSD